MTRPPGDFWPALRQATTARIGLGRSGTGLPTTAHLEFQLAHARARDAVYAALDVEGIGARLAEIGLEAMHLRSAAADRPTYLRRPDLGRRLDPASRHIIENRPAASPEVLFVIADGLSATAVNAHAVDLLEAVLRRLPEHRPAPAALPSAGSEGALPSTGGTGERATSTRPDAALPGSGPVAVVEGGRVAIGDEIGGLLGADLVAVLIGERPGLSAADSLGVYVTWQPAPGTQDAARNCLSNIRPNGMPIAEAADTLLRLFAGARRHRMTGLALSQRLAQDLGSLPGRSERAD